MRENGILFDSLKYVYKEPGTEGSEVMLKPWYESAKFILGDSYVTGESFTRRSDEQSVLDLIFEIGDAPPPCMARATPEYATNILSLGSRLLSSGDELAFETSDMDLDQAALIFALMSGISPRKVFITMRRYIGLGPARMQVGDVVYVLSGGNWPSVLRAAEFQTGSGLSDEEGLVQRLHAFVADCCVHGIMDGEFARDRRDEVMRVYLI